MLSIKQGSCAKDIKVGWIDWMVITEGEINNNGLTLNTCIGRGGSWAALLLGFCWSAGLLLSGIEQQPAPPHSRLIGSLTRETRTGGGGLHNSSTILPLHLEWEVLLGTISIDGFELPWIFPSFLKKHRKNLECCPGHYLIVNHYSSMSGFKFRNFSHCRLVVKIGCQNCCITLRI